MLPVLSLQHSKHLGLLSGYITHLLWTVVLLLLAFILHHHYIRDISICFEYHFKNIVLKILYIFVQLWLCDWPLVNFGRKTFLGLNHAFLVYYIIFLWSNRWYLHLTSVKRCIEHREMPALLPLVAKENIAKDQLSCTLWDINADQNWKAWTRISNFTEATPTSYPCLPPSLA